MPRPGTVHARQGHLHVRRSGQPYRDDLGRPRDNAELDQANRLTGFGTRATYAYDGDGLRTAKTVNGTKTAFTWDEAGSLPMLLAEATNLYVYGPGGLPLEKITGTTPTYLLHDQQGSTRLLVNAAGVPVGSFSYDTYGRTLRHAGPASTPLQFDGQYTDAESGFQYLRARYYDPATAQFLTADPLVSATGEPYGFAGNNPLNELIRLGCLGITR